VSAGRILVVDDDPVILQLLRVNFELEGYEVLTAQDGDTGLSTAREQHPDLVLLDVMMPGLTGLEVAGILRAEADHPPVMLLSAKAQSADVTAGLDVADDYVTKPFDPFELLERVAVLLARRAPASDGSGLPTTGC
jgi:DNA-binding response OmpR family regulator